MARFAQVMRWWNDSKRLPFLPQAHGVHASGEGTIFSDGDGGRRRIAVRETEYGGSVRWWSVRLENEPEKAASQRRCDRVSPVGAVMLHLRARYVSKAAILTIPASLMPLENRSPA
jgi:hypothetical protein